MVSGALVRHAERCAWMQPCEDMCIPRCVHTGLSPTAHTRTLPPSGAAGQKGL